MSLGSFVESIFFSNLGCPIKTVYVLYCMSCDELKVQNVYWSLVKSIYNDKVNRPDQLSPFPSRKALYEETNHFILTTRKYNFLVYV